MKNRELQVIALVAAYNEEDVIAGTVGDLIEQGISVYVLDHGSSDDTATELEPFLGRGLLAIENLASKSFSLHDILRRKEELARELEADWLINADADEFRESPWAHLDLYEGIRLVDRLGYNAIDFEVLNFWPTHDDFRRGDDPRQAFPYYEPGHRLDKLQIRCWKKLDGPFELQSSAGHSAVFPGREVFPIRFLLRHYPFRGLEHAHRKLFEERRPRYDPDERREGWHHHYDDVTGVEDLRRDPAELRLYDPERARLDLVLRHRGVEELEASPAARGLADDDRERELALLRRETALLHGRLEQCQGEIDAFRGSLSWRCTAPLRFVGKFFVRKGGGTGL